eukprot:Skav205716  [mRNA]  locus=scaffold608:68522:68959:- [translate_table: standard]
MLHDGCSHPPRFEQTPALFEMTQPHHGKGQLSIRQAPGKSDNGFIRTNSGNFLDDQGTRQRPLQRETNAMLTYRTKEVLAFLFRFLHFASILVVLAEFATGLQFQKDAKHCAELQGIVVQAHARHFDSSASGTKSLAMQENGKGI